ncbi:unnamed protein product [Arctia plantaginis]|uniref:Uncharacterized protein n=1 Tax=Arctia plantaginis TaxID=874455 RepID=A0A8S1AY13_ARCPL|nr:unnamed protein product [Arctia plantaginis]
MLGKFCLFKVPTLKWVPDFGVKTCLQAIYNTWLWCNFLKDWNTGGSSSQPTVAPPLPASEVHSQSSPVTAVAEEWKPPEKKNS